MSDHGRSHALSSYLHDLGRHPPLSREEEHELAVEYRRTGAPRLAERLVCANLRLVVKIAREYRWSGHELLDLIEEGNLGLLLALRRYDPERGVRLSSYAALWIRSSILHFTMRNRRLVRVGTTRAQRQVMVRLRAARQELEALGASVDPDALAGRLGVPTEGLESLVAHLDATEVALDAPVATDDKATRLELLPGGHDTRPDVMVEKAEGEAALGRLSRAFVETLGERDQRLFHQRWLGDDEAPTLQEMGHRMGVSRERARQLETRLMDRFRSFALPHYS